MQQSDRIALTITTIDVRSPFTTEFATLTHDVEHAVRGVLNNGDNIQELAAMRFLPRFLHRFS